MNGSKWAVGGLGRPVGSVWGQLRLGGGQWLIQWGGTNRGSGVGERLGGGVGWCRALVRLDWRWRYSVADEGEEADEAQHGCERFPLFGKILHKRLARRAAASRRQSLALTLETPAA